MDRSQAIERSANRQAEFDLARTLGLWPRPGTPEPCAGELKGRGDLHRTAKAYVWRHGVEYVKARFPLTWKEIFAGLIEG